jgi:hypothetical protein
VCLHSAELELSGTVVPDFVIIICRFSHTCKWLLKLEKVHGEEAIA